MKSKAMLRVLATSCALVVFLFCGGEGGYAQRSGKGRPGRASNAGYLTVPFDPAIGSVPRNFRGHDPKPVFDLLQKLEKGEFESTEEFESRLAESNAKPFFGSVYKSSLFAFVLDNVFVFTSFDYDADRQKAKVSIKFQGAREGLTRSASKFAVPVKTEVMQKDTYSASNVFGMTKKVERTISSYYELVAENLYSFPNASDASGYKNLFAEFSIDRPQAKQGKYQFGVIFVCRLKAPYQSPGLSSTSATLNLPYETLNFHKNLHVDLVEVWLYDKVTGAIYVKQAPKK